MVIHVLRIDFKMLKFRHVASFEISSDVFFLIPRENENPNLLHIN